MPYGELRTDACSPSTPTNTSVKKFTGQERDSETNLDYFGARHYASMYGRFLSPDPIFFQASMTTDPQQFNLYAYVRNNPLVLVDPDGEAIQLTGDADQRKQQLAALCSAVGEKACPYLYENEVPVGTDDQGNTIYEYYVGIYTNGPDGQGQAFEALNPVAEKLAAIIGDERVAEMKIVPAGTIVPGGGGVVIGPLGRPGPIPISPGATVFDQKTMRATIYILDPSVHPGTLTAHQMSDRRPGALGQGILTGHEFGHVAWKWNIVRHSFSTNTNKAAVDLENDVRRLRDPNAPIRRYHD